MDAEHYIRETLGLPCQITSWNGTASLPLFLTNGRTFSKLTIDNTSMLIAERLTHSASHASPPTPAGLSSGRICPLSFSFPGFLHTSEKP